MANIMRLFKLRPKSRRNGGSNDRLTPETDGFGDAQGELVRLAESVRLSGPIELEYVVDGLPLPSKAFNAEVVRDALHYEASASDVFVATYPKTGTTWTQYIVWMILNLDHLDKGLPSFRDIMTKHVPFLEIAGRAVVEQLPEPRIIKHHLPFWLSPYHPLAKYLVIVRNPFDCVVSFYHHSRADPSMGLLPGTTFDEFFEEFLAGRVPFGSYFDNVLSWYARRDDSNVFFFYYETLKERPLTVTLDIAEFLDGRIAERLRGDEALLHYIVDQTSFGSLKASAISAITDHGPASLEKDRLDNLARNFFRKGEVGDWKRHFKPEQERRLRRLCEERLKGTGMWRTWEKWLH